MIMLDIRRLIIMTFLALTIVTFYSTGRTVEAGKKIPVQHQAGVAGTVMAEAATKAVILMAAVMMAAVTMAGKRNPKNSGRLMAMQTSIQVRISSVQSMKPTL